MNLLGESSVSIGSSIISMLKIPNYKSPSLDRQWWWGSVGLVAWRLQGSGYRWTGFNPTLVTQNHSGLLPTFPFLPIQIIFYLWIGWHFPGLSWYVTWGSSRTHRIWSRSSWQLWLERPLHRLIYGASYNLSWTRRPCSWSLPCLGHLLFGLLQFPLHGTALEGHRGISTKLNAVTHSDEYSKVYPSNDFVARIALASRFLFLDTIQDTGHHF